MLVDHRNTTSDQEGGLNVGVVSTFMEAITLIAPCRHEKYLSVAEWSFHSSVFMIETSTFRSARRLAKFYNITPKNVVNFIIDNNVSYSI